MDKKSRDLVMGKLYLKNKDYKMAEKSFSDYLNSNPEDFQALKMLAQVQEHLNDTAKAFDLYQRCYLSQPDRKGVLLDICRLLLVNDSRLNYVDQKKWLKLAVQAFPSNPIVTNLRESLPNSQDSHPGKITTEDMILEKLTLLDDRFKNFEDKLESIFIRFDSFEDKLKSLEDRLTLDRLQESSSKPVEPKLAAPVNLTNNFSSLKLESKAPAPATPVSVFGPPKFESQSPAPVNLSSAFGPLKLDSKPAAANNDFGLFKLDPKPVISATNFGSFKVDSKPAAPSNDFSSPKADPKPAALASDFTPPKLDSSPAVPTADLGPKLDLKPPVSSSGLSVFGKLDFKSSTQNNDSSFKFDGVNLFAESLKKMNLPAEGLWTTPAPKKDEPKEENAEEGGDDDDGGVVATEELPIENTCDMRPIEIKTGEEDEDIVFKHRCKLFRFRDKEYKERGLGDIKVLKHKETGKGRLIMRRELVNLVCLNCWSCQNIERVRDTQVRFAGLDASDGDPEMTVFLAKFKTQELTDEFMKHLNDLFTED